MWTTLNFFKWLLKLIHSTERDKRILYIYILYILYIDTIYIYIFIHLSGLLLGSRTRFLQKPCVETLFFGTMMNRESCEIVSLKLRAWYRLSVFRHVSTKSYVKWNDDGISLFWRDKEWVKGNFSTDMYMSVGVMKKLKPKDEGSTHLTCQHVSYTKKTSVKGKNVTLELWRSSSS